MIHILHGDNTEASYNKLRYLEEKFQSFQKIKLDEKSEPEHYTLALFSDSLIDENKKIVICTNFISGKKVNTKDLEKIISDKNIIFWEKKKLNAGVLPHKRNDVVIEEFKLQSKLYVFLDSLSDSSRVSITQFNKLPSEDLNGISWHLSNRFLLLLLAKLNFSAVQAGTLSGRTLQNWQWSRIKRQASRFNLSVIRRIYSSLLKVDYLIKTGKTNLSEKTLIPTLFFKYLKS